MDHTKTKKQKKVAEDTPKTDAKFSNTEGVMYLVSPD
jgi:hypothetical protein